MAREFALPAPMRFLPLVWSGIWRKPVRTALIFLQVCVAFALFGVLQGMKTGMDRAIADVRADILYVSPAVVGGARLPIGELNRLQLVPGVKTVSFNDTMLATYQKSTESIFVLAIPPSDFFRTLEPETVGVQSKDLEALRKIHSGVLITTDIGKKYGWHIGDEIPLTTSTVKANGSTTWTFDIVGIISDHERGEDSLVVANYYYLDEARALNKGTVGHFYAIASDPEQAAAVSDAIDRTFANSASPTLTTSFRERTPELVVLKTLGFGNRMVFILVAAESLLVCIAASLTGLALAWFAFPLAAKYMPGLSMPMVVVAFGILGAVLVALISVSVPGLRAARVKIVDALTER